MCLSRHCITLIIESSSNKGGRTEPNPIDLLRTLMSFVKKKNHFLEYSLLVLSRVVFGVARCLKKLEHTKSRFTQGPKS